MASFRVQFYERSDKGRPRLLKTVPLPAGRETMGRALGWAGQCLDQTPPELAARVSEVRVTLVETSQPAPAAVPPV